LVNKFGVTIDHHHHYIMTNKVLASNGQIVGFV
jgi:hypothetical protein